MGERVRIEREGSVAFVTLTRPEKHNGMDFAMLREVVEAQRAVRRMRDVRSVILAGEGPSFKSSASTVRCTSSIGTTP